MEVDDSMERTKAATWLVHDLTVSVRPFLNNLVIDASYVSAKWPVSCNNNPHLMMLRAVEDNI